MCDKCKVMEMFLNERDERIEAKSLLMVFVKDYEEGLTAQSTEWIYKRAKKLLYGED